MRTSVERRAERKAAAIAWQKENFGSSRRANAFASRDDKQDEIIPLHGRRGRGRISVLSQAVFQNIRTSSEFSAYLAKTASVSSFWKRAEKIVGDDITANPNSLPLILDTSVVVAGLFSHRTGSPSRRLMELALADSEEIIPCVTNAIVYEYRRVLKMFGDDGLEQLYRLLFRSIVIPVLSDIEIPPVEADHSDTPFVQALVLTMRGSVGNQRLPSRLTTYDHHLLNMTTAADSAEILSGRIITPGDLLRELKR